MGSTVPADIRVTLKKHYWGYMFCLDFWSQMSLKFILPGKHNDKCKLSRVAGLVMVVVIIVVGVVFPFVLLVIFVVVVVVVKIQC